MALPFNLREVSFSAEGSFLENAESASSNTWTSTVPVLSVSFDPMQDRIRDASLRSRTDEENLSHIGPREGSLEFTTYWPGHLAATTGALSQTWWQDLVSDGLGGGSTAAEGTTVLSATTSSSITFTATTGFAVGMGVRIGAKGDGRCDGQYGVLLTVAAPCTFSTAFPGTPNAGDVIYASQVAHHDESVLNALGSKRFLISHATTGAQYHFMGCQLSGLSFSIPIGTGGLPTTTFRYRSAYWQRQSTTFPSGTTRRDNFCAPVAGGSVFLNTAGTATRATYAPASMELELNLGLEPVVGPGSSGTYGFINEWVRTGIRPTLTLSTPWATTFETLWDTSNATITNRHILATLSVDNGTRSVGFYMPNAMLTGKRPSSVVDRNGQNYVETTWVGLRNTVTTNALIESSFRCFSG